jgi:tyrosine-protein kinase Etk/Wzc
MDTLINKPNPNNEEVYLLDFLIVLAKHSRMIIYTTVAVMILTYLVLFIRPNKYTASARLLIPQQNTTMSAQLMDIMSGTVMPGKSTAGGMGGLTAGLLGLKSPAELYVAMLGSDTISDRMISKFDLKKLYKTKYIEDTRKALKKSAKITAGKKDAIITIEVTDKNAKRAADIANAYTEELDKFLQGLGVREATGRLAFLEKELTLANVKLTNAEEALRNFSEKNSVIQIDTQTKGMLQYIAQLRAEIDTKEVQVQVMRQQATSYNYDVVRLETQVKGLKDKLRAAEKQWDQTCMGDICLTTSKMPVLGLEYIRLLRNVKFQEGLFQLYTKMVEIARLDMVKDVAVVQVLDQAMPPGKRSNTRQVPSLIAGVVTFFVMIFFVVFREYLRRIEQNEDIVERLAVLKTYLQPWKI